MPRRKKREGSASPYRESASDVLEAFETSNQSYVGPQIGLEELCRSTKFSRREIQAMYRSFKQDCPSGVVNEETFKSIFARFFPFGNAGNYAHFVFNTFDENKNGAIGFKELIQHMSLLCRGTPEEKLQWAFQLYDIDGDGYITKKELTDIICSIYALMGKRMGSRDDRVLTEHVDRIFQKMDVNKDGVVSLEEFMTICLEDETVSSSLALMDTIL